MDYFSFNFLLILPELVQVVLISSLLFFSILFSKKINKKVYHTVQRYETETISPLIIADPVAKLSVFGLVLTAMLYYNNVLSGFFYQGFETIIWDVLAQYMSILLCCCAAASIMLSLFSFKRFARYEHILLIWLSVIGMLCLIKSNCFIVFYLSIELQSLCFFMLTAMKNRTESSIEAAIKYFFLSAFSSSTLLLGMLLAYASTGSQNFDDIATIIRHLAETQPYSSTYTSATIALFVICLSLLFKLGAAPLHFWLPDVYEGAQTSITAFFAISSKVAAASALIRVFSIIPNEIYTSMLSVFAFLSLVIGTFSAMRQTKIKRLIAYSGIANIGWFLLAMLTGQWKLLILHVLVYILLLICLFSVLNSPFYSPNLHLNQEKREFDYSPNNQNIKYISDLKSLLFLNPCLALSVIVVMFGLAGIPPVFGFYSKFLIMEALAFDTMYGMLGVSLIAAALSAFYYIRVIKVVCSNNKMNASIQLNQVNAVIICWTNLIMITGLIKPEYISIGIMLI